jgi:acetyltransferase-like isoleucine patch superfamily enzyme
MRRVAGWLIATFYRFAYLGRIRGNNFIIRPVSEIRVERGNFIRIGDNVMIGSGARIIANGGDIEIGENVFIGKNSTLIAFSNLTIGAGSFLGQNCSIHTENHGGPGRRLEYTTKPVRIDEDVWLGAGVVVTAGKRIGAGATVGANSVVTKNLEPGFTYAGVPARHLPTRS